MILDVINAKYRRIMNALMDDESKKIFNSRVEYMITRDEDKLRDALFDSKKTYTCSEIDQILKGKNTPIVIFGAGENGRRTKHNLERCNKYVIKGYYDNNLSLVGKLVDGIPVISPSDAVKDNNIIIITSQLYGKEIYEQLIRLEVEKDRIVTPTIGYLEIQCDWQYFDLFEPLKREVFVDAGTFDGSTIIDFYKWAESSECIAYGMEPVKEMYKIAVSRLANAQIKNAQIYENAAWNCNEDISMCLDVKINGEIWGGSGVTKNGNVKIKGKTIDSLLEERVTDVTFIKMDVEGSELKALEGSVKSIVKYKPRLAISIYHKPQDILEIPNYILNVNPNYKFYIRHYTGDCNETVLYATT